MGHYVEKNSFLAIRDLVHLVTYTLTSKRNATLLFLAYIHNENP